MMILPWPPSANRYWRTAKGRTYVSKEAETYKNTVRFLAYNWKRPCLAGRIAVAIYAYPPDKRKRDIDNLCKVTIDALQYAGLFLDDCQIDRLFVERKAVRKNGELIIEISEIASCDLTLHPLG